MTKVIYTILMTVCMTFWFFSFNGVDPDTYIIAAGLFAIAEAIHDQKRGNKNR